MSDHDHDHDGAWADDAALYALDALPPEDAARFAEHLHTCTTCQEEVASVQVAMVTFADDLAQDPPPELRDRVLAAVALEQQEQPDDAPEPALDLSSARAERRARAERSTPRRTWWPLAAAAAAVVTVGGAFLLWPQDPADRVLEASDAQVHSVSVEGATVEVVWSEDEGQAALRAEDLPPAPAEHDMQVWAIDDAGVARSLGLIPRTDDDDYAIVLNGLTPESGESVGITVEPEGGSSQPTTDPMAVIPLDA